jgi:hypothetical protein
MCFWIDINNKKVLRAKKAIVCYKILDTYRTYDDEGLCSQVRSFIYKLNKTYRIFRWLKSDHEKEGIELYNRIDKGFHSYISKTYSNEREVLVRCLIPKRAKYFMNDKQYVSNRIKIIEILAVK